ncbi:MAG: GIY-YIG nuclease family protein [Deltaproteobacteria bacterium]|nr:GIY-YIG nuclease family protein [Deltaproteobacteria bacterium]
MMHYVYILECCDSKSYVGCTSDLKSRLQLSLPIL